MFAANFCAIQTTPEEVKKIIAEMAKDVPQEFYMHGFKVNGLKYTFLKKTADGVYGRGSDGHSGVCVCRTVRDPT